MKKSVLLGILGISLISVVALALFPGAPRPVQYTWKAIIIDPSPNLTGGVGGVYDSGFPGWIYEDSDEFATVSVGIRKWITRTTTTYEPLLRLEVLSPTQFGLKDIQVGEVFGTDTDRYSCGFPNTQGGTLPYCWDTFLNHFHPQEGYQKAQLLHYGDRFMTEAEADITKMLPEERETRVMHLSLFIQGQDIYGSCDQCDSLDYHQVDGDAHGYWKPEIGGFDIFLTRINENTWKVVVNTDFDNPAKQDKWPGAFSWGADKIWESYCECVPGTGKNGRLTKTIQYSSWVRAHLCYEMLFIRTPK